MTAQAWDALHTDPRHWLEYPSEHVVRFLTGLNLAKPSHDPYWGKAVDIGAGSGRHTELLMEKSFWTTATDASADACGIFVADHGHVADMTDLPFSDNVFDVAIAYGVFYYGTRADHRQAVAEMRRVLRPGGKAFVCDRSAQDWRAKTPIPPDHPEHGMEIDFITEYELEVLYSGFSDLTYERTETTREGRAKCDSDWLISITK